MDKLVAILEEARTNEEARNRIIEKYTPFILKAASEFTSKYINPGIDEEYSISLLAFNEAIDSFDNTRGISFFTFARTIIKRRLIDYYRKNKKKQHEIPMVVVQEENRYVEYRLSEERYGEQVRQIEMKDEIFEYRKRLSEFDISFDHLVKISPRKKDARNRAKGIAGLIVGDRELTGYLMKNKLLPLKELEQRTSISRKTMERNRKYIIAIVLILTGDYRYLRGYISGGDRG